MDKKDEITDVDSSVLLVDDEEHFLNSMYLTLQSEGISSVERCKYSSKVMPLLEKKNFPIIFLDILMPDIRGDELLPKIVETYPEILAIMLTAVDQEKIAKKCLSKGAFDYLVKPILTAQLMNSIKKALNFINTFKENLLLKETLFSENLKHPEHFKEIITINPEMLKNLRYIEAISKSPSPVLITGETGVGKELMAKAIYNASQREGKFVEVNIAGLDDTLFSDTLFGHVKGAYTGAVDNRDGLAAAADNGTIFLDEIGDLEEKSQIKLLKFIEEKKCFPLGSDESKKTNAQIVLATNKDISKMIEEKKFRNDLYYRLKYHCVHIPPLRLRKEDIPLLLEHFIKMSSRVLGKKIPEVPEELYDLLSGYNFPGNIRELKGMIEDAVSRSEEGTLEMDTFHQLRTEAEPSLHLPVTRTEPEKKEKIDIFSQTLPTFREMEMIYLEEALKRSNGNKSKAARLTGLERSTFINKLNKSRDNAENADDK